MLTALVWGANRKTGGTTHSALAEVEAVLDRWNTIYGRLELAQKTAEDLAFGSFAPPPDTEFNVGAISAGYIRELLRGSAMTVGVGFQGTVNAVPRALEPLYGSRAPVGGMVFIRVRPVHGPHLAPLHHPENVPQQ